MTPTRKPTTTALPGTPRPQFSLLTRIEGGTETLVSGPSSENKLVVDEYNIILRNPFRFKEDDPLQEKLENGESFTVNTLIQSGQAMYAKRLAELDIPCTFFCRKVGDEGKHIKYSFHPFNMVNVLCESSKDGEWLNQNDMTLDRFFERDRYGEWRDESTGALMRSATGELVRRADEMFHTGFVFESREDVAVMEEVDRRLAQGKRK